MLDDEIWGDVGCFLDSYVLAESQDVVVIAYSAESRNAAAWIYVALKQRGVCAATVCMVALRDPEFAQRLKTYLPAPISLPGRLLIITLERDTLSHSNAIREAIHNFEQARCVVLRLLNAGPDLFRGPLRLSPSEIAARNAIWS